LTSQEFVEFVRLFRAEEGRRGVTVTFVAILELLREGLIEIVQAEPYAPLHVRGGNPARHLKLLAEEGAAMKNLRDLNERTIRQECHRSGAARRRPPVERWMNSWRCSTSATARPSKACRRRSRAARGVRDARLELVEVASGYRIQIRAAVAEPVSRLWQERPAKYSRALLETLALVAYRQPITRGEIEQIRGVAVNPNIIKTLLERNWIRVVGIATFRASPELLGTTREFLDYFGLKKLDDLPTLAQLKELEDLRVQLALPGAEPVEATASVASAGALDAGCRGVAERGSGARRGRRCRATIPMRATTTALRLWMRQERSRGLVARRLGGTVLIPMPPRPPRNRDGGARGKARRPAWRRRAARKAAGSRADAATRRAPRDGRCVGRVSAPERPTRVRIGSRRCWRRRASARAAKWSAGSARALAHQRRGPGAGREVAAARPHHARRQARAHTRPEAKELHVLLFHRSPGETLDLKAATSRAAEHLQLPRVSGRWLAIQPMPPVDGGLEILTDDGTWAHRMSQGVHALTVDYVLRMRGPLNDDLVEEFRAATDCEGEPMTISRPRRSTARASIIGSTSRCARRARRKCGIGGARAASS
jgi:segregation and condensation protein B